MISFDNYRFIDYIEEKFAKFISFRMPRSKLHTGYVGYADSLIPKSCQVRFRVQIPFVQPPFDEVVE